ncbi:hypothetical protein EMPS_01074 [Entomortierella parvispora]|uniref:Ser-Thr-rich glycosyl-phosphatidyl-inositol-anchored membrane family-domain-containing protein n=1 Tax=Entomortierella parvispora TaxID=205924 RepID=A0A9P3H2W1_9FUNG|nr:hypothetical protein EMPS_01074 [Entomortierella parvispora]
MKFCILIAAVASMAIASVTAHFTPDEGRLFYSEPVSASVWTAGETQTVSWSNYCKPGNKEALDIVLYMSKDHIPGSTDQMRVPGIRSLGTLNCLENKSAKITLPKGLTTGSTYSLHVNTVPLQSYSAQFTIKGEDPVVVAPVTTTAAVDPATATATTTAPAETTTGTAGKEDKSTSTGSGSVKAALASTAALFTMAAGSMLL